MIGRANQATVNTFSSTIVPLRLKRIFHSSQAGYAKCCTGAGKPLAAHSIETHANGVTCTNETFVMNLTLLHHQIGCPQVIIQQSGSTGNGKIQNFANAM